MVITIYYQSIIEECLAPIVRIEEKKELNKIKASLTKNTINNSRTCVIPPIIKVVNTKIDANSKLIKNKRTLFHFHKILIRTAVKDPNKILSCRLILFVCKTNAFIESTLEFLE